MEKKRVAREKLKAEQEEKRRQKQGADGADKSSKPKIPEEEEDIVDALLKEIRRGKTLRRRSIKQRGSSTGRQRRSSMRGGVELKQDDIARLQTLYKQAVSEENTITEEEPKTEQEVATEQPKHTHSLSDSQLKRQSYKRRRHGSATDTVVNGHSLEEHNYQLPLAQQQRRHSATPAYDHYETTV